MKITNLIENIAIAVITAIITIVLTVSIMEATSIRALKNENTRLDQRLEKQNDVIIELAKLEKYKIENRFEKLKPKESTLVISLDNKLTALELDSMKITAPEVSPAGKKGFWKKLKFW